MVKGINREKLYRVIFDAVLLVYACFLFYLYYNQLLYPVTGRFESDTAVHVRFAVEEHYYHSLAAFIYIFLSWLPASEILIATVLTIATIGAIISTRFLILKVIKVNCLQISDITIYITAIFANLVMGFYVKSANSAHYIGYECANMWHNSTYIFMRLFAILTVISFFNVYEKYKTGLSFKEWLGFSLLLMITTGFKASFLTVFAPLMAIVLLWDLVKGVKFINVFKFGISVFPSILIMWLQSLVLAGDSENGYAISPFTALSLRGEHPKITLVLSVLFPLTVLFTHLLDFYKDRIYFCTLIMWAISFLLVFFLVETGERNLDGNFMWGYSIALFFLFLESMLKAISDFKRRNEKTPVISWIIVSGQAIVLLWHVFTGIKYFSILLTGVTYFA